MPRKGQRIKRLKPGQLIGSATANQIIDLCNALLAAKIVNGTSNELLIGDLAMVFKIKGGATPNAGGSSSYRGEYEPTGATEFNPGAFVFGDIVRVGPSNANAAPVGDIIQGVYICVADGPTETDLPNHPLSTGGETIFWQWLATYPTVTNGCDLDGNSVSRFTDEQDSNA